MKFSAAPTLGSLLVAALGLGLGLGLVDGRQVGSGGSGGGAQVIGPSTTVPPFLTSKLEGVTLTSLVTVDDTITADNGYQLIGIPDGLGVVNGPLLNDTDAVFYLLANHELAENDGAVRAHGGSGAFVSQWRIEKATLQVLEGSDLITTVQLWDWTMEDWMPSTNTSFNRFCSSDIPAPTALYNSATGAGTQEIIYFNGEETAGGRVMGTVVSGPDAGTAFHLAHFGYYAVENVVLSPAEQDLTVAMGMDDSSNGEVYVYVGTKTTVGNDVTKAGLVNGTLYALAVPGKPYEVDDIVALNLMATERFVLKLIGEPGNYPQDGLETTANGLNTTFDPAQPGVEALKFAGPEDGSWDPRVGFQNVFYFVSKGSTVNGRPALSRIWRCTFDDIANPVAGGTLEMLFQYPGSFDNVRISDDGSKLLIQEDLDNEPELSRILLWDLETEQYEEVAAFDGEIFYPGGDSFLTTNEESSGIISLEAILGPGYYALSAQVHTSVGLSDPDTQVEYGQILIMQIDEANRQTDVLRTVVIDQYASFAYKVDGLDPPIEWTSPDYTFDPTWVTANGTAPLGYGEAPGILNTDVGQPETPRPLAYYFRTTFDLPSTEVVGFNLLMRLDDGAVVYINGVEVLRQNVPLDSDVSNTTAAVTTEEGEDQWKSLPLGCLDGIIFQDTGNVLSVSIHQDSPTSSDIRVQVQLEAYTASADFVPPAEPQGFAATNATASNITLAWDEATDTAYYLLERKISSDAAFRTVKEDIPGTFDGWVDDDDIEDDTEYIYRLTAVSLGGRSDCIESNAIRTEVDVTPILFEEQFSAEASFGQFTYVNLGDEEAGFSYNSGLIRGNGFGVQSPTEDWLITTNPLNFHFFREHALVFDSLVEFSGPFPEWRYSSNYDPAVNTDPSEANWTTIYVDDAEDPILTTRFFDLTEIATEKGYFGVYYASTGGGGGQSVRYNIDNIQIQGECGFDFSGAEASDIAADPNTPWTVVNLGSEFGWQYDTNSDIQGAFNNNFGSGVGGPNDSIESDDWLVSPPFAAYGDMTLVKFNYYERFSDVVDAPLSLLVTDDFTGDVTNTTWEDITPIGLDGSVEAGWIEVKSQMIPFEGENLVMAFRYVSSGAGGSSTKRIGVDFVCVEEESGDLTAEFNFNQVGGIVTLQPILSGGAAPFTYAWDFGDGSTSSEAAPTYTYETAGTYTLSFMVTDSAGASVEVTDSVTVTEYAVPSKMGDLRVASFNVAFSDAFPNENEMENALMTPGNLAIMGEANIIKEANPDVVFLNEWNIKYLDDGVTYDDATTEQGLQNFIDNYLAMGEDGVTYEYTYVAPCNTGVQSGFDFSRDGTVGDAGDGFGFGSFPGRYCMALLSKYPVNVTESRTFQTFLWKDMPGAYLPPDPNDVDGNGDNSTYYTEEELAVFRLSSKSHWDIVIDLPDGETFHLLGSHPTPPVFDDGTATEYPSTEVADFNGYRNHDEIRFWWDYIDPDESSYVYDDAGVSGGLSGCDRFVIVGDQNADPIDGDSTLNPASSLLASSYTNGAVLPISPGAVDFGLTEEKTSEFGLRVDYALASNVGWNVEQSYVYWPIITDLQAPWALNSLYGSDHRMVVVDLTIVDKTGGQCEDGSGSATNTDSPVATPPDTTTEAPSATLADTTMTVAPTGAPTEVPSATESAAALPGMAGTVMSSILVAMAYLLL